MTRVCVIGDSHVAALHRATTTDTAKLSDDSLTYFAAHVQLMPGLTARDGQLVPGNEELRQSLARISKTSGTIDVGQYDRFVVIGLAFGVGAMINLATRFRPDSFASPLGDRYPVSDACFIAAAEGLVRRSEAFRVADMLLTHCDKPVTVIPSPNPSHDLPEADLSIWLQCFHASERSGEAEAIGRLFSELCARMSRGDRLKVFEPPVVAVEKGVFNKRLFTMLPEDMSVISSADRVRFAVHGNERYGAELVRLLFNNPAA